MNKLIMLIAIVLMFAGCSSQPVRQVVCEPTEDGTDIWITRDRFFATHPELKRYETASYTYSNASGFDDISEVTTTRIHGYTDPAHRFCFTLCDDPEHPTWDDRNWMTHEHAHRKEDLYGFAAAVPLWESLAPRYRTHPGINQKLKEYEKLARNEAKH